ncbi:MAG: hypothetical protein HC817_11680 [Saprospiraceae bacterium]|nr:hypothetical protein [Saprospiraceae bacterium]
MTANVALWDSLNAKYSGDDAAKMRGGDLDFVPQGMMVPEFNDLIFYKAQQGKLYTVQTQFGAHIVQVTGVRAGKNENRVRLAIVREPIIPGSETDRKASSAADELLSISKT